jgi:hypothetical protein
LLQNLPGLIFYNLMLLLVLVEGIAVSASHQLSQELFSRQELNHLNGNI